MGIKSRELAEEAVSALIRFGSRRAAAKELGIHRTSLRDRLETARQLGIEIPDTTEWQTIRRTLKNERVQYETEVPEQAVEPVRIDNAVVKRLSTHTSSDGRVNQWVIEEPNKAAADRFWRENVERLCGGLPAIPEIPPPKDFTEHQCVEIPIGDHHFGMLAWDKEAGGDYDLGIADQLLRGAIYQLIGQAPKCKLCVIEGLGDFEHFDSLKPVTPTSANILDSDTRYPKMAQVAIDAWIVMIQVALQHFAEVLIIIVNGNHDPVGQTWLRISLVAIFRDNPRVRVERSPSDFQYWEFGRCLIGCYHGHIVKMQDLPQIMAQDRPQAWGRTEYRYWRTGHVHHAKSQRIWTPSGGDYGKTLVESFRVLPPTDAWAHNRGYRSMRNMQMILLHKDFGELNRYTVNPAMLTSSDDVR